MKMPATGPHSRLERELEREREDRHKNDDARIGSAGDEELRNKDARENDSAAQVQRGHRD